MVSKWRKDSWGNGSTEIEWKLGSKLGGYCIAQQRGNSDFHYIVIVERVQGGWKMDMIWKNNKRVKIPGKRLNMRLLGYGLDVKRGKVIKQCEVFSLWNKEWNCHLSNTVAGEVAIGRLQEKPVSDPEFAFFYINIAFSTYNRRYKVGYWIYGFNVWAWFIMLNVYVK